MVRVIEGQRGQHRSSGSAHPVRQAPNGAPPSQGSSVLALVLAWLAVSLPLAWGITETFRKALALFS